MATLSLLRFTSLPAAQTLAKPRPAAASGGRSPPARHPSPRTISMSYHSPVPATDRLVSALSYTLPFFNSLHYGRFLFARYPPLALAVEPLLPLLGLYRSVPYASFLAFFALYLGVARNPAFSRYARFNAMQAVVLDVFLTVPMLFQRVIGNPSRGIGFQLFELGHNVMFVFAAVCFVYSLVSSVLGRTPHIPIVAAAANRQE